MTTERWKSIIEEWRVSGLSQSAFCRERNLNKSTFSYWLRRFRDEEKPSGNFVELGAKESPETLEVRLASGTELRIPNGFNSESLKLLLETLR